MLSDGHTVKETQIKFKYRVQLSPGDKAKMYTIQSFRNILSIHVEST